MLCAWLFISHWYIVCSQILSLKCMYVNKQMCGYTHTDTHRRTYTHTDAHRHTYTHTYIHTCTYTHTHTHTHAHAHFCQNRTHNLFCIFRKPSQILWICEKTPRATIQWIASLEYGQYPLGWINHVDMFKPSCIAIRIRVTDSETTCFPFRFQTVGTTRQESIT